MGGLGDTGRLEMAAADCRLEEEWCGTGREGGGTGVEEEGREMGPKLGQCAEGENVLEGKVLCCMDAEEEEE